MKKTITPKPPSAGNTETLLTQKWGSSVIDAGYTVVPSVILRAQRRLHLNANQLAVLLHLLDFWWQPKDMPWPTKKTIAERMGVADKTVQRAIATMEAEGLLKRADRYKAHGGRTSNRYDLEPLVNRLEAIAKEMLAAEQDARQRKDKARRPSLRKALK